MTSTLQQEASRKLRFTAQTTMRVAQRLYERGYITYMRTDSTTLSETALTAARTQARELYGQEFVPDAPRRYDRKVKNAQEAHEAIRPAGERFRLPADVRGELDRDEQALYELVWMRTVASQMADARGQTVSLRVGAIAGTGEDVEFGVSGTVITFRGFLAAYEEGRDEAPEEDEDRPLPHLKVGDAVQPVSLEPQGHETSPPARYTEPTLVKALEDYGIGRPSTYASILGTILDRGYVVKRGQALVPTFLAFAVTKLLEQHYDRLVDYDFTARMEDDLDRIADGEEQRVDWLRRFYRGENGEPGLHAMVTEHLDEIDARDGELDRVAAQRHRRAGRQVRAVPGARRFACVPTGGDRARRAHPGEGRGAAGAAVGGALARRRPGDGPHRARAQRPLRAVRHRGAHRRTRTKSPRPHPCSRRCRPRRSRWTRR